MLKGKLTRYLLEQNMKRKVKYEADTKLVLNQ